ncbi:cullin 1 [Trichoderma cornu-damae]|uniref:Cullin 1 n=1 Tax=Trichoderma cornu-damae TaxID=654480 RepID=A0A9P8TTS2_9HYPO|nr:cullin 1 [Trichoderma cornu-damae]
MTSLTPAQTEAGPSSSSRSPASTRPLSTSTDNTNPRLRPARTLPPWVVTYDERHGPITEEQLRLLSPPRPSAEPQRNFAPQEPPRRRVSQDGFVSWEDPELGPPQDERGRIPHFFKYGRASARGRKWDHLRSAEPVIVSSHPSAFRQPPISWGEFIRSSAWGRPPHERSEIIDIEALNQLQPNFNKEGEMPLHPADHKHDRRRKSAISKRVWNRFMRSSLSPLLFRLAVVVMSIIALAIAARMYELEIEALGKSAERTQSIFAIAVDSVAIPFNGYMIYDEYTGKPLGLRSAVSKMSLILLDLFFIIFKSAGTALAFENVVYHTFGDHIVLGLSKALASFMLLGLLAWTVNFTVNIFRVIERLGGGEDEPR